jgi:hypothetical protein
MFHQIIKNKALWEVKSVRPSAQVALSNVR